MATGVARCAAGLSEVARDVHRFDGPAGYEVERLQRIASFVMAQAERQRSWVAERARGNEGDTCELDTTRICDRRRCMLTAFVQADASGVPSACVPITHRGVDVSTPGPHHTGGG